MKIAIDKEVVKGLDIDHLKALSLNAHDWHEAGQCEYRLYAHLSTLFNGTTILDVGSRTGGSALALSYNEKNQVISYDLEEQGASSIKRDNITWKIQDFREDDTLDFDNISTIDKKTISKFLYQKLCYYFDGFERLKSFRVIKDIFYKG